MKNVKYIPGDLVKVKKSAVTTANDTTFSVASVCVGSILEVLRPFGSIAYHVNVDSVIPIPITPQILMDNGWKLIEQGIDDEGFEYGKYFKDYQFPTLIFYPHIRGQVQNMSALINNKNIKSNLFYCHELQHLLFGLGLPSELKV